MSVEMVDWRALSSVDREAVLALEISALQVEFAGPVGRSVTACEAGDPAEVAGLAVRVDGVVAGWVVLKRGASAPHWVAAGAAVVSGLRIDARHQGRGIGAAALVAMARWVACHWPAVALLTLRVDDGNAAGIRAYEKAGWMETGERRVGRVGVERTMSLPLRAATGLARP
jgi:GNAT superfamily N-acetyltransferase